MNTEIEKSAKNRIPVEPHTSENEHSENMTFNDLDRGWSWMVLLASFGVFWVLGGNMYALSITQTILLERFNESVALTSWTGALQSGLISSGGPLSSLIVDRYSCRVAIVISGFLYAAGHLSTAFVNNIHAAILTYGVLGGIGGAVGYVANLLVIGFNFRLKRNLALGISASGTGIDILSFAPMMELSKYYYGSSGFFILTSGVCLHLVLFGVMCFPSSLEKYTHVRRNLEMTTNQSKSLGGRIALISGYYIPIVKNKAVIFLGISKFLHCFGSLIVFNHFSSYIMAEGFPVTRAASILSVIGVTSVIGRVLIGILASFRQINVLALYVISDAIFSFATLLFPLYSGTFVGQVLYGVISGLLFGNGYVLITSINIQYVGISNVSAASGFEFFLCGIGSILGPVIAGCIVDSGGTYKQAFILGGAAILLATVAAAVVLFFPKTGSEIPVQIKDSDIKNTILDSGGGKPKG